MFCDLSTKNNKHLGISDINFDEVQFSGKRKYFGSTGK